MNKYITAFIDPTELAVFRHNTREGGGGVTSIGGRTRCWIQIRVGAESAEREKGCQNRKKMGEKGIQIAMIRVIAM